MKQLTNDPEHFNFLVSQIDKQETIVDDHIDQIRALAVELFENKMFKCFHKSRKGYLVKVRNICMRGRSVYCAVENPKSKKIQVVWWRELRHPDYKLNGEHISLKTSDILINS